MLTVAVAGGSSPGLGRSIVSALLRYPDELEVIVLSRQSSNTPEWLQNAKVGIRKVDYASEDSLFEALQGVHTIICVLLAADGTWARTQKNLLHAGLRAGISRFAPAEFGLGVLASHMVDMFQPSLEVMAELKKVKESHPGFEYTGFHAGLFMNYLGYGASDAEAATHGMRDTWVFVWDVKNMRAEIPLTRDGEVPSMTLTEIADVGRFVAAACLLPKGQWQVDFSMEGETLRMDKVVEVIEEIRGGKMVVQYRPYGGIEKDEQQEEVEYPNKFWLQVELVVGEDKIGAGRLPATLNQLCPTVKPISIREYLNKFWR